MEVGVEDEGDFAFAQAGEVGAADEARAFVAAKRELDGGVVAGGVRMDLDGEEVVAAAQVVRGDGERFVFGAVDVGGEGVGGSAGIEAAAGELDAVQVGGEAVGVADTERERL